MNTCAWCCKAHTELADWPSLQGKVCPVCEPQLYAAQLEPQPECLRVDGPTSCEGRVTYRASYAGTGTQIAECAKHQEEAAERDERLSRGYPDSSTPPSWFDPSYAGESWDGDY